MKLSVRSFPALCAVCCHSSVAFQPFPPTRTHFGTTRTKSSSLRMRSGDEVVPEKEIDSETDERQPSAVEAWAKQQSVESESAAAINDAIPKKKKFVVVGAGVFSLIVLKVSKAVN